MRRPIVSSLALASALVLMFASSALGAPHHRSIQVLDNCDGPSFNAVLGEEACSRAGGLSFDKLFASLASGGAPSWRFSPARASIQAGGWLTAYNRGGEFHTFTPVAAFGGGVRSRDQRRHGSQRGPGVRECRIPVRDDRRGPGRIGRYRPAECRCASVHVPDPSVAAVDDHRRISRPATSASPTTPATWPASSIPARRPDAAS